MNTDAAASAMAEFEAHRSALAGIAYRMLGSHSDTEDVLQDAWLRWRDVDPAQVEDGRRYLARVVSNLCLDRLKSARAAREVYVGSWLPEPIVSDDTWSHSPPEVQSELAEDLSVALMLALERLSPQERAAFILHDVFGFSFDDLAEMLDKTGAACRKLASRARSQLKREAPRYQLPISEAEKVATAFSRAISEGDIEGLTAILTEDARFVSDGGGVVAAVPKPVLGAAKVAKVLIGFAKLYRGRDDVVFRPAQINGMAGFVISEGEEGVTQTVALEINDDRRIRNVYIVRNPHKLRHVQART